ncbi:MAG: transglutaminase domain-containing protein [Bacteroidota bacterium]
MFLRYLFAISYLLLANITVAQTALPILHSNDTILDMRVGDEFHSQTWTIMPDLHPDPYGSSIVGQRITFYSDLDSISCVVDKDRPFDFIVVLGQDSAYTRVHYEPTKLDVLKAHAAYEADQDYSLPVFTYESKDMPALKALRSKYNLDSIAGQGNDVSQLLNLMRWVHNTIPHDGSKPIPGSRNADKLLTACGNGKGTLNCRGLGIVLNEVYLAMGFSSRFVTCMPKDTTDTDCHVINTAYAASLEKWIWLDPTQNAYAMDDKGTLLSIAEVRERLIEDQPLILNPDANWNYRGTTDKAWYLEYYMAKNLYYFSTPLHSTYDYETRAKGKKITYVELWPAGEGKYLPRFEEFVAKSGTVYHTYRTYAPAAFWAPPTVARK